MNSSPTIKVWDISVRLFHWSLVVLFLISYLTGDDDSLLHVYSGYAIIVLLVYRIIWGLIGPRHARFTDFVYGWKTTSEYARSMLRGYPKRYIGHNPLGGWMVIAMLTSLALTTWSGLKTYGAEGHGPLAALHSVTFVSAAHADDDDDDHNGDHDEDEFWEEIHEFFANFTLFLVAVHIAGVALSSLFHGENLVRAMITGKKERKHDED